MLAYGDDDAQAVRACLKKARRSWARVLAILRRENVSPRTAGKFFQAIVQAILLFGSETWDLRGALLKQLQGFQTRACWRMAKVNRPVRGEDGVWKYPPTEDVLKEVGLKPIADYIRARRDTIAKWVADRPVYEACTGGERRRGTSPRQFWWEQPMKLPGESDDESGDEESEE